MSVATHDHPHGHHHERHHHHHEEENPFAGQGSVLLDIGGDVGALVVEAPRTMLGVEVEIRPAGERGLEHLPHVAVVDRPLAGGGVVPSLVFGELGAGTYELFVKGTRDVHLVVDVRGGEVTWAAWAR
ncbi:hypothetical protein QWY28_13485 [Nocardioides sp. SOB77]|uniref:Uncharacterized protein n=1 Tax=Nocardioides oceani TaxID=3058369 RepID=A0ABT8FH19_9ACTN|nr:hypothetical protein [Nocardioides oceani]MDN4173968.1 hypothetical protein [Nocardioides oceani]